MEEISKEQFDILKSLCDAHVYTVLIPDIIASDPVRIHENRAHHMSVFSNLAAHGFAQDITTQFTETVKEIQAERETTEQPLTRGFTAFVITEQAIKMFSAPEGLVN